MNTLRRRIIGAAAGAALMATAILAAVLGATPGGEVYQEAISMETANYATATNAAATVTLTGIAGKRQCIQGVNFSYGATPGAGATLSITADGSTIFRHFVTSEGMGPIDFSAPWCADPGDTVVVTLSAGGAGVEGTVSVRAKAR